MPREVGHGVQLVEPIPAPVAEHETVRGNDPQQAAMFSNISPEERMPPAHSLRLIRGMVNAVLTELSPQFDPFYSHTGRPSIALEKVLRTLWLQVLYTVRCKPAADRITRIQHVVSVDCGLEYG
jgi:hypothetical protein